MEAFWGIFDIVELIRGVIVAVITAVVISGARWAWHQAHREQTPSAPGRASDRPSHEPRKAPSTAPSTSAPGGRVQPITIPGALTLLWRCLPRDLKATMAVVTLAVLALLMSVAPSIGAAIAASLSMMFVVSTIAIPPMLVIALGDAAHAVRTWTAAPPALRALAFKLMVFGWPTAVSLVLTTTLSFAPTLDGTSVLEWLVTAVVTFGLTAGWVWLWQWPLRWVGQWWAAQSRRG